MSTDPAHVAKLDQATARAADTLDSVIHGARITFSTCGCGRAIGDAQHVADLSATLTQAFGVHALAEMLAVAVMRAVIEKGGAA